MKRLLALAAAACAAVAQQNAPHAGYVFPAGGQAGQSVEVTVGGQFLNGARAALFSGAGVEAEVLEHIRPLTPMQATELREKLQEINRKPAGTRTAEEQRTLVELREKLLTFQRRQANPMLSEQVRLRLTLSPGAVHGLRELRLVTQAGLTNPIYFAVGNAPEAKTGESAELALPIVVNGRMAAGAIDRYRFRATKGERLRAVAEARVLLPYIADAVPGWVQAVLVLRDAQGHELAGADRHLHQPDPVLEFVIPDDGLYLLEVRDALFRGRDDFVYRVSLSAVPPAKTGKLKPPPKKTQRLKLPAAPASYISRPGEWHVYRLDAKAGDEFVAEVRARRLGSPLDSILKLTDAKGRELAVNDDFDDPGAGLVTHQADSRLQYKFAAKGTYYLRLGEIQNHGGPEYEYKLLVRRPRPDFELRVAPATLNLRANGTAALTVYALRRDGFQGEIKLSLAGAPRGFALQGAAIPAGQDKIRLTLSAPPPRTETPVSFTLEGESAGLRRAAAPVEEMTQAFAWHHLVPAEKWLVQVLPAGRPTAQWRARVELPLRLTPNSTVSLEIPVPARLAPDLRLSLVEPPEGLTMHSVTPTATGLNVTLQSAVLKPGLRGNLIFEARVNRQLAGILPAIPFAVAQ